MTYSIIGILASIILFITNRDVLHTCTDELSESDKDYLDFSFVC